MSSLSLLPAWRRRNRSTKKRCKIKSWSIRRCKQTWTDWWRSLMAMEIWKPFLMLKSLLSKTDSVSNRWLPCIVNALRRMRRLSACSKGRSISKNVCTSFSKIRSKHSLFIKLTKRLGSAMIRLRASWCRSRLAQGRCSSATDMGEVSEATVTSASSIERW